jgi:hypothetical protein
MVDYERKGAYAFRITSSRGFARCASSRRTASLAIALQASCKSLCFRSAIVILDGVSLL